MRKGYLLSLVLVFAGFAHGAGNDLLINQRNPADTITQTRGVVPPGGGGTDALMGYVGASNLPAFYRIGSGLAIQGGQLVSTVPAGATGPAGPKGDAGAVGATGTQGLQGIQGLKGDAGVAGPTGAQGQKGDTGSTGPQGIAGSNGPKGDTGATGERGATGLTGSAGPTGVAGPTGSKGDTGLTGATGAAGAVGPAGPQGDQGLPGAQGLAGPQGLQGAQGLKGNAGATGATGLTGATGPTGPTGPSGISKRLEQYTGTTDANGLYTVTYATAFTARPSIQPEPPLAANQVWVLVSSTTTGFSLRLTQRASVTLLGLEVLLSATTNVSAAPARVQVIEG